MDENRITVASIVRTGVVKMQEGYGNELCVNQDDMLRLVSEEVKKINPKTDFEGKFAGRVTIMIETLGDLEEEG